MLGVLVVLSMHATCLLLLISFCSRYSGGSFAAEELFGLRWPHAVYALLACGVATPQVLNNFISKLQTIA